MTLWHDHAVRRRRASFGVAGRYNTIAGIVVVLSLSAAVLAPAEHHRAVDRSPTAAHAQGIAHRADPPPKSQLYGGGSLAQAVGLARWAQREVQFVLSQRQLT